MKSKNATFISVYVTPDEKAALDEAAVAAGLPRNRFVRDWILSLVKK